MYKMHPFFWCSSLGLILYSYTKRYGMCCFPDISCTEALKALELALSICQWCPWTSISVILMLAVEGVTSPGASVTQCCEAYSLPMDTNEFENGSSDNLALMEHKLMLHKLRNQNWVFRTLSNWTRQDLLLDPCCQVAAKHFQSAVQITLKVQNTRINTLPQQITSTKSHQCHRKGTKWIRVPTKAKWQNSMGLPGFQRNFQVFFVYYIFCMASTHIWVNYLQKNPESLLLSTSIAQM